MELKTRKIKLTQGKFALIDDCDYELVRPFKWHAKKERTRFYASSSIWNGKRHRNIRMHRLLLGESCLGLDVDHKNHDTLDNRRSNLRVCTRSQNIMNTRKRPNKTSKYLGVSKCNKVDRWRSTISKDGKNYHLGNFKSELDAAVAYNKKAKELFGEFAVLNLLERLRGGK